MSRTTLGRFMLAPVFGYEVTARSDLGVGQRRGRFPGVAPAPGLSNPERGCATCFAIAFGTIVLCYGPPVAAGSPPGISAPVMETGPGGIPRTAVKLQRQHQAAILAGPDAEQQDPGFRNLLNGGRGGTGGQGGVAITGSSITTAHCPDRTQNTNNHAGAIASGANGSQGADGWVRLCLDCE